jgi:hypothetical protein
MAGPGELIGAGAVRVVYPCVLGVLTEPIPDMVHVRLNERESNPNPHVNFISALDVGDPASQEDAR